MNRQVLLIDSMGTFRFRRRAYRVVGRRARPGQAVHIDFDSEGQPQAHDEHGRILRIEPLPDPAPAA
jgi:hypothetical protein